ncbi:unnamed protein product [Hyaloperonospora brassicae]|uniref:Uncharacterized protein n=1 Tax=Hyaloperonospora brassicae TaxID=162125 RepID=A0AAV0TLH8_HYABA|nr:unnamed protein product [Hyaloperonospora brassicae]
MANARLKQARRRATSRSSAASSPIAASTAQLPVVETAVETASVAPYESLSDASDERAALEAALAARKRTLAEQLHALTLGKPLMKELLPDCDAAGRRVGRCHRDYLLQEMEWMAADFSQERKWRVRNAKALGQALVSYVSRQEARLVRQQKRDDVARRRTAARVGREVKKFWSKIDKIIAYKVKLEAEELKQRQMQRQLKQLVEQTEKYADALAASFQEGREDVREGEVDADDEGRGAGKEGSRDEAVGDADFEETVGDADFVVTRRDEENEAEDESTIDEEEKLERASGASGSAEELRLLKEESEMSIEQLRARYATASYADSSDDDGMDLEELSEQQHSEETDRQKGEEEEELEDGSAKADVDGAAGLNGVVHKASATARKSGYKRPYLLTSRLDLREYQEAGVNWLISMCQRRINGILADEMGLGKTIQTISLLAHLAWSQGLWGPHLIVVPTSCLVNWEMEFKRWCPAFKVLTYFGSAKRRKELRQGWSKQNAFHVCITSYQLVVQDAHCFKRKKWYYLILDEAHNIKNWKSLRWQTLLTFSSQRRLLLTGTPLQNNLLELWALMHFLMPHVFASRKEFTYWFQNPLALMVENGSDAGQSGDNGVEGGKDLVTKLHGIIRPFVLRRLKKDVEKQLPGKFEHVITCQLSKRQRYLYEDFISRSSTRRAMFGRGKGRGANFMSMMNVLMQLRKVCNHPDLFEPRPIASPLDMPSIRVSVPSRCGYLVAEIVNERPHVAHWTGSNLPGLEVLRGEKFTSKRRRKLFFYDVSAPLPDDTVVTVPPAYVGNNDIAQQIIRLAAKRRKYWEDKRASVAQLQKLRSGLYLDEPVFGGDLIRVCTMPTFISSAMEVHMHRARPFLGSRQPTLALQAMVRSPEERLMSLQSTVNKSICYVPKARAKPARVIYGGGGFAYDTNFVLSRKAQAEKLEASNARDVAHRILAPYHESFKRTQLFFPDKALVQFDCGKLQQLAVLLRTLKHGGHRCLIFTQMSSMLNILEVFLNLHGHTYFRLDGATKVEKRQTLMERFNRNEKIFCFILSTRSGGLGINLTGADAVIFYDSDWNPAMDAQAQDRAHRIGQTRDVHIYRLVSEHTVEENILRKAQQKRHLDFLVMSEGQFTTDFFSKASLRELMVGSSGEEAEGIDDKSEVDDGSSDEDIDENNVMSLDTVENTMAQLEDEEDVVAMKGARAEYLQEQREFDDEADSNAASPRASHVGDMSSRPSTPSSVSASTAASEKGDGDDVESKDDTRADEDTTEEDYDRPANRSGGCDVDTLKRGETVDENEIGSRKRQRDSLSVQRSLTTKRLKVPESNDQNGKHGEEVRERARDAAEEQKLQAWKASVRSLQGFEDSLNSVDRYALHFREDVDPLYACTPAQQAAALAGIDVNPATTTLLEDIEQTEVEKREEEARLIAEGELIVGHMDCSDDAGSEQMTEYYADLYRRERAHVLFEQRKRLLTGAAWTLMKCAKTGKPFYYNTDTREAMWDCPAVRVANEQFQSARGRGYEGLPPPVLLRVLSMLDPFPGRYCVQMVCRSWHVAAQHQSLFVKISASACGPGSSASLAKVLANVASGETVLFGPGVYHLDETVEISKCLRLLAAPDAHVELQMHSCRAQLCWNARGGVICGFHFTRTNSTCDFAATDIKPSSDATELAPAVEESRRVVRKRDKKLCNWQNLLRVAGHGQLRVEYCEFDGKGLGNACICVWGCGAKKRKRSKRKRARYTDAETVSTLKSNTTEIFDPMSSTSATFTTDASAAFVPSPAAPATLAVKSPSPSVALSSASDTTKTVASLTVIPATALPRVATPVNPAARVSATGTTSTTLQVATGAPIAESARASISTPVTAATAPAPITPVAFASMASESRVDPPCSSVTSAPQCVSTSTSPVSDTLLVLHNCRIRGAGSSGVLLVRGSLVMSLNTVEENAHSGVTVLGGQALVRLNKIQRNARFGLRLLYHAGSVIVEDNVVFDNACGNLDVDNSGRRFVVRMNEMDKGKKSSERMSHSHGKLRLKTYAVLEKEVPRATTPVVKPATSTAAEYWKKQLATSTAVSSAAPVPSLTATQTGPVVGDNGVMTAGIPMSFMRSVVFPQGSNRSHVTHLPPGFAPLGGTVPSMTLNRSTTTAASSVQRVVNASGTPGIPNGVRASPELLFGATSAPTALIRATSCIEPPEQHCRPKTNQVVVGGRELMLRDTCEKPTEKVVKPRRSKDPPTQVLGSANLQQITSPSAFQLNFAPGSTAAAVAAAMGSMMAHTAKLQAAASRMQTGLASSGNNLRPKPAVVAASTAGVKAASPKPMVASLTQAAQTRRVAPAAVNSVAAMPCTPKVPLAQTGVTPPIATKPVVAMISNVSAALATPRQAATMVSTASVAAPSTVHAKQSTHCGEKRKLDVAGIGAKAAVVKEKTLGRDNNGQPGIKSKKNEKSGS